MTPTLVPRPVATGVDALVPAGAHRSDLGGNVGKSGARLERLETADRTYVLKHLSLEADWIRRATGDLGCRAVAVWELGLLGAVPDCIDTTVVGAARELDGRVGAVLMDDVSAGLVPVSDDLVPLDQHRRFLDHMAALHVAFWGLEDELGLFPLSHRVVELAPCTYAAEREAGRDPVPPRLAVAGWGRLPVVAPRTASVVLPLLEDPSPLVRACAASPWTLVHGNWKLDNLGSHPDGRTIVLDWGENTGRAPGLFDLAWYLAINCRRLPESKEATIEAYRAALETRGIGTAGWWDQQVSLALIGAFLQLGWEKALGEYDDELAWWDEAVQRGAAALMPASRGARHDRPPS